MRVCGYKYHNQARCREQATTMTCPCGCGKPTKPGGNKYHNQEHYVAHRQAAAEALLWILEREQNCCAG